MPHHHLIFLGGGSGSVAVLLDLGEFALVERSAADEWDIFTIAASL